MDAVDAVVFKGRCQRCRNVILLSVRPRADPSPRAGDLFIPGGTDQRLWCPELDAQRCCGRVLRMRRAKR